MKDWNEGMGNYERVLENADAESFSEIKTDENLYGKDKSKVYYENKIISGADPSTFKYVLKGYAIDKNRAYYYDDSLAHSNPKRFEIIDVYFSKDDQNVFYKNKALNVCSVDEFSLVFPSERNVLGRWSTDGCSYFYNEYKVPSNDYENTIVYKGSLGISRDKNNVYQFDKPYFDSHKRTVFIKEKGIVVQDTIDIETFTIKNNIMTDKFGQIN